MDFPFETPVARFLRVGNVSAYALAKLVGTSYKQMCNWRDGLALPGVINAIKLERVTNGEIPVVAWLSTPLGQKAWEHKADWDTWQSQRKAAEAKRRARNAAVLSAAKDILERGLATAAPALGDHEPVLVIPEPK